VRSTLWAIWLLVPDPFFKTDKALAGMRQHPEMRSRDLYFRFTQTACGITKYGYFTNTVSWLSFAPSNRASTIPRPADDAGNANTWLSGKKPAS